MKTTLLGHKKQGLGPLHGIIGGQCPQLPKVCSTKITHKLRGQLN
jgi:hypothetical protein